MRWTEPAKPLDPGAPTCGSVPKAVLLLPQCCPSQIRTEMMKGPRSAFPLVRTVFPHRTPNGIRTRATAVKGRGPGPLDDGGRTGRQHRARRMDHPKFVGPRGP